MERAIHMEFYTLYRVVVGGTKSGKICRFLEAPQSVVFQLEILRPTNHTCVKVW